LCYHSNATTLKNRYTIYTKTNKTFRCLSLNQSILLHEGLNNHKIEIVCNFIFYNMLKCQKDRHLIPCLHHIHVNINIRLIINHSNFVCIEKEEPWTNHNNLNFLQNLFINNLPFSTLPCQTNVSWDCQEHWVVAIIFASLCIHLLGFFNSTNETIMQPTLFFFSYPPMSHLQQFVVALF
jgi:hypothetical protein